MMKYLIMSIALIGLVACKKSNFKKYVFGSEKKMVVTEHNVTIEGIGSNLDNRYDRYDLDLDGITGTDLTFVSFNDSIEDGSGSDYWGVFGNVKNENIQVLQLLNSGDQYYYATPYSAPDFGPPYLKSVKRTSCDPALGDYVGAGANYPITFNECDPMERESYNWSDLYEVAIDLVNSGYDYTECFFNESEDSLLCDNYVKDPSCQAVPFDQKFYLAFRKLDKDCYYLGWIELFLTDKNKLTIYRTAISEKPLEF